MRKQSRIIVMILVLVASLMMPVLRPSKVHAADVPIDETNFPNANFREFVKHYDTNNDGILQQAELNVVTSMDCGFQGITDITGVEHFVNLETLYCYYNGMEFWMFLV